MAAISIETKKVDIPARKTNAVYPLKEMSVGQSFFVPFKKDNRESLTSNVSLAVWRFKKKNPSTEFTKRTMSNGIRVWRTK